MVTSLSSAALRAYTSGGQKPASTFATSKKAAQGSLANLIDTREQEWSNFYAPVAGSISELGSKEIDYAGVASDGVSRGGRLFDVGMGAFQREMRGLGDDVSTSANARMGLRRKLLEVDTANRAIQGAEDRRTLAQIASAGQMSDLYGNAGSIYGNIAQMEMNRKAQHTAARAAVNGQATGAVGTAAGIIASI